MASYELIKAENIIYKAVGVAKQTLNDTRKSDAAHGMALDFLKLVEEEAPGLTMSWEIEHLAPNQRGR